MKNGGQLVQGLVKCTIMWMNIDVVSPEGKFKEPLLFQSYWNEIHTDICISSEQFSK